MKRSMLKRKIKEYFQKIIEASTTAGVPGYATPFSFTTDSNFNRTKHSYSAYTKKVPKTNIFFKPIK